MARMKIGKTIGGKIKIGGKENADRPATAGKAGCAAAIAGRKIGARATGAIELSLMANPLG